MADTFSQNPNFELAKGHWIIDGTGWSFQAIVYDTTAIQHKNILLNTEYIQMFEYSNQWNSLVLSGQIIYKDSERQLGKLFRIPHLIVKVEWSENLAEKKTKKKLNWMGFWEDDGDYWVEHPIKKEDHFSHMFLVNKMEIIAHDSTTDITTYRLELVSASWYKLSSLCQYSNYNLKKPERITDIICKLLVDAVGLEQVATKTFKEDPCKTDIKIFYTTSQHDNYFTAINYLLNRMYMEPSSFDVDNHPRIILWDEKERQYCMGKLTDDSTCFRVRHNTIQLNRFYEVNEKDVNPYGPGHAGPQDVKPMVTSVSKMSYTRFIKDFYTRHYWDLNITKDKFVRKIIMNEKIQNTFKSPDACPKRDTAFYPNPDITAAKDNPDLQQFLRDDKTLYLIDECKWNNQRHMYNDCIHSIVNRDSFTLTRTNKVCHQPWQVFYCIRRKVEMKEKQVADTGSDWKVEKVDESGGKSLPAKTEANKYADNQYFGPWYTYKTTHTININGTTKGFVPQMIEKLHLVKPFEITPVPKKIRK